MPELLPHYDRVCALVGNDDRARPVLSHYRPPPVIGACSQAVWFGDGGPALVRNYDFDLDVVSDRARWRGEERRSHNFRAVRRDNGKKPKTRLRALVMGMGRRPRRYPKPVQLLFSAVLIHPTHAVAGKFASSSFGFIWIAVLFNKQPVRPMRPHWRVLVVIALERHGPKSLSICADWLTSRRRPL